MSNITINLERASFEVASEFIQEIVKAFPNAAITGKHLIGLQNDVEKILRRNEVKVENK